MAASLSPGALDPAAITMPQLRALVHDAYASGDNARMRTGARLLAIVQKSAGGWALAHALLEDGASTQHELFFGAATLQAKLQWNYGELSADGRGVLHAFLLKHLSRFAGGPELIRSRICLAVATLAVQWREWAGSVRSVLDMLMASVTASAGAAGGAAGTTGFATANSTAASTSASSAAAALTWLRLAQAFPEALDECGGCASRPSREAMREQLAMTAPHVLGGMVQLAAADPAGCLVPALQAAAVWIRVCRLACDVVLSSHILDMAFAGLAVTDDQTTFNAALELCMEVTEHYYHRIEHRAVLDAFIPALLRFTPNVGQAIADEDETAVEEWARLFCAGAESCVSLMFVPDRPPYVAEILSIVINCTSLACQAAVRHANGFWLRFAEFMQGETRPERLTETRVFMEAPMQQLLPIACQALTIPANWSSLAPDLKDEFKHDYRPEAASVVSEAICSVLDYSYVFTVLHAKLTEAMGQVGQDENQWRSLEAYLYVLGCVVTRDISDHRNYPSDACDGILHWMIPLVPMFPTSPVLIDTHATLLQLLDQSALWLSYNVTHIPPMIAYCLNMIQAPDLASHAADAVCHIMLAARDKFPLAEAGAVEAASHTSVPKVGLVLLQGLAAFAARQDLATGAVWVEQILSKAWSDLNMFAVDPAQAAARALADGHGPSQAAAGEVVMSVALDRICTVFAHYSIREHETTHPVISMLTKHWDLLCALGDRFSQQRRVMEKLCRLHKTCIKTCGVHYRQLVTPLLEACVRWYCSDPRAMHAGLLYVVSVLIAEFGREEAFASVFTANIKLLVDATAALLAPGLEAFTAHPDIIEDFFRLINRALDEMPVPILSSSFMSTCILMAIAGLRLEHKSANRSINAFFEVLFDIGVTRMDSTHAQAQHTAQIATLVGALTAPCGQTLVTEIVQAIAGNLPASRVDDPEGSLAAVLYSLKRVAAPALYEWFREALNTIPEYVFDSAAKDELVKDIQHARDRAAFEDTLVYISTESRRLTKD